MRMSPARPTPRIVFHYVAERRILDRRTRPVAEIPVGDTFERHVVHLPRHGILDRETERLPNISRLLHDENFKSFFHTRRKLLQPLHGRKSPPTDNKALRILREIAKRIDFNVLYAETVKDRGSFSRRIKERHRCAFPRAGETLGINFKFNRIGFYGGIGRIVSTLRYRKLRRKPVPLFGVRRLRLEGNRNELHVALHQGHLLRSRRGDASADLFHAPFRRRRVPAETVPNKNEIFSNLISRPVSMRLIR